MLLNLLLLLKITAIVCISIPKQLKNGEQWNTLNGSSDGEKSAVDNADYDEDIVHYFHYKNVREPERLAEITAEDILPLLPRNLTMFTPLIDQLKNEQCKIHVKRFFTGLHFLKTWAVQMFDSAVKVPEGIISGSTYQLGNFDECIDVATREDGDDLLSGQYCLATVSFSGVQKTQITKEESDYIRYSVWDKLKVPETRREYRKDVLRWAFCVPASCEAQDVQQFLSLAVDVSSVKGLKVSFDVPEDMCQVKRKFEWDMWNIVFGCILALFLLIVFVATLYDLFVLRTKSDRKSRPQCVTSQVMVCFSAFSNLIKLTKYQPSNQNLDSIFGIKAMTMIFILMGHAVAFIISGPSMNSNYKEEAILKVENGLLINNPLLVDSFLLIGAFLFCRLLLLELDKRKFINPAFIYIARIVRLTPAYAVVLAFYCTWFYHLDSGPLWESRVGLERTRCRSSWWANVLYINNYVNSENLCMFQSWYLAVDTHLFFLAPLLIYPLWKWSTIGETLMFISTALSVIIPFVITLINRLDPVLMMYANEIADLSSNPMYTTAYIKTHMRSVSYLIGLLLGYLVHKRQNAGEKLSKVALWFGWILCSSASILSMFTVSIFYTKPYDATEAAIYSSLHRVGWCLGVAWVIYVCVMNYAGALNRFLSRRIWVPVSRLTYCAYLVNGLVELHTIGTLRHTRYLNNLEIFKETTSHILMTFGCATVLCLLFESPILGLLNILLKKHSKSPSKSSSTETFSKSSTETYSENSEP